ncbi:hypothetical protein ROA7450_00932 [Roseovarius albus]|uniref:DUF4864 domain-containing protein n=1 Tax=Roseovarius albus TaxID=1247867 RepID=A0A1X6YK43_9RHOB|nr:DUF4864 domain-containing protein [Roseovarius albus]SLN23441.1 hypothetical protein ROA7450_00932 [Roseovarius albus]
MKQVLWAGILALLAVLPARADEAAIQSVISSQIEAFLTDDFERAFEFASPTIQDIFKTPDQFGRMVREGYPMVWRPADVQFLSVDEINGVLWQTVLVQDGQGNEFLLGYQMIDGPEGWKINAVRMKPLPLGAV